MSNTLGIIDLINKCTTLEQLNVIDILHIKAICSAYNRKHHELHGIKKDVEEPCNTVNLEDFMKECVLDALRSD